MNYSMLRRKYIEWEKDVKYLVHEKKKENDRHIRTIVQLWSRWSGTDRGLCIKKSNIGSPDQGKIILTNKRHWIVSHDQITVAFIQR